MSVIQKETQKTKEALLLAAEALFAERGIAVVALRDITEMAGANVASVSYHFGGKDRLIDAVLARHVTPINVERLRRLDELETSGDLSVKSLLRGFMEPLLQRVESGDLDERLFAEMMGRCMKEGENLPEEVMGNFGVMLKRYVAAFQLALPKVPPSEIFWRLHCSFGVLSNAMMYGEVFHQLSRQIGRRGKPSSLGEVMEEVIRFSEGGFMQGEKNQGEGE